MNKGLYIAFEGGEGCGKGTQQERLALNLEAQYPGRVLRVREPGGTPFAEVQREIIFRKGIYKNLSFSDLEEAKLFALARENSLRELVKPALEEGKIVLSDRSYISSLVYQGIGRGLGVDVVWEINRAAVGDIKPNLVFLLDLDPEKGLRRKQANEINRFEKENLAFHQKIAGGYRLLAGDRKYKMKIINGEPSRECVALDIWQETTQMVSNWEMHREIYSFGKERR